MEIIELSTFSRVRERYFDNDEFFDLAWALYLSPHAGDVVPGSGGVRKLRWQQPGRGKSGGARVIYYVADTRGQLFLLTAYAKNEASDLPRALLNKLREAIDE